MQYFGHCSSPFSATRLAGVNCTLVQVWGLGRAEARPSSHSGVNPLLLFAIEADIAHPDCPDCCPGSSTVRDSGLFFSVDADIPHGEAGDEAEQRGGASAGWCPCAVLALAAAFEKKVASGE